MKFSKIIGCGSYLPSKVVLNDELPKELDTSDEWIQSRTGIKQRYLAEDGELTSDLATKAAQVALDKAGLESVDLIIVATTTPDQTFPSTATSVQRKLGITSGFAFDVQAVCSGFVYALNIADNFIKSGQAETALVIGAETMSRILNWEDRGTCVLFGDGAGAVILQSSDEAGIIDSKLYSDGNFAEELQTDGGVSLNKAAGVLAMNGREVFKHAVEKMSNSIVDILAANKLTIEDVNWVIPHQANRRIIDAIGKRLGVGEDKIISTVDIHANTSAASIPLAICEAEGKIKEGDLIVLTALGAGFTWGASLVRW